MGALEFIIHAEVYKPPSLDRYKASFACDKPRSFLHNHATATQYFFATATRNVLATMPSLSIFNRTLPRTMTPGERRSSQFNALRMQVTQCSASSSTKKKQAACSR